MTSTLPPQAGSLLTQCPYNQSHFVPEASLGNHRLKCRYGLVAEDEEEEEEEEEEKTEGEGEGGEGAVLPSRGSGTPCVKISESVGSVETGHSLVCILYIVVILKGGGVSPYIISGCGF